MLEIDGPERTFRGLLADLPRTALAVTGSSGGLAPDLSPARLHAATRRVQMQQDARPNRGADLRAAWCAPCREETPTLALYATGNIGRRVVMVGINVDELSGAPRRKYWSCPRLTAF